MARPLQGWTSYLCFAKQVHSVTRRLDLSDDCLGGASREWRSTTQVNAYAMRGSCCSPCVATSLHHHSLTCRRMDTYGEDTIITTKERDIELVPRLNKTVCLIFDNGDAVTSGIGAGSFVAGSTPVGILWPQQPSLRMPLWKRGLRGIQLSLADRSYRNPTGAARPVRLAVCWRARVEWRDCAPLAI